LVFLKSPKYQACCCFVLDCRNNLLKYERQGHSFPTRYNNTHMYTIHTHTHTHTHSLSLCLSFSPEFQFQMPAWVVLIVTPEYQSHNMLIYTCTASLIEYLR
jgi:hypothetical protein